MPFIYYKLPCKNKLAKPAVTGQHKHPLIQPNYFSLWGDFSGRRKCGRDINQQECQHTAQYERVHLPSLCVSSNLDWEERG